MKASSSIAVIAGVAVAALGLIPLALIALDTGLGETDQDVSTTTTTAPITASLPPTTIIEVQPPELEGVEPTLSRVLYAYGAATGIQPGTTDELPEQIVRVLAYYDVTLNVAEERP